MYLRHPPPGNTISKVFENKRIMNMGDMKMKLYEQLESIQLAIKLLVFVIFVGYIMIWIMMPTNVFWLHWLPEIHTKVDSTYFGQQGTNILIYTVPILLIAILGCLYLHLDKYVDDSGNRSHFSSWKRPVFVRGPLGIISWTELSFLLMFFILLVWSFSAYVHGMFKNITRQSASNMREFVWEVKLHSAALLLGLVGNICLTFLFFPVTRGSSILRLVGLTSEASVKYHIWIGHTVLTLSTAHGLCYLIFWVNTHQISEVLKCDKVGISNVAGEIALLSGLAMWITSFNRIRRKLFELFFYTHYLYIAFIVFYILHVGFFYSCIMLPGFYLFLIDRYLRFLQSQQRVRLISARVLPCQAVELNFAKDSKLDYSPSSIIFINVKSVAKLQWHPFSVTSNSNLEPDRLSIIIKSDGSWSQKLYEKFSSQSPMDHLEVHVEGPYGHSSTSFLRYNMLVMVSGGSGITAFISIIRELLFMENTTDRKIPRILLVAAFKKSTDLTMLDLILPVSGTTCEISCFKLQIQAYITRDKNPSTDVKRTPQIIWFKPSILDGPVSAILGPNSWLWLGAIISASFVIFLMLIGVLTRYIIRQTEQNTNYYYSYPKRSVLSMLFLGVSVVIAATIAFTWNKKQNIIAARQIQSEDTPTPMASPVADSWQYEVDRELESLPQQSFTQITTVHYGQRPNLENILSGCDEASVGVMVSGPKKMRKDVATICSSGLAKNLEYESFSFDL